MMEIKIINSTHLIQLNSCIWMFYLLEISGIIFETIQIRSSVFQNHTNAEESKTLQMQNISKTIQILPKTLQITSKTLQIHFQIQSDS